MTPPPNPQKKSSAASNDTLDSLIAEATTFAGAQAKDVAAVYTASAQKVQNGTYKVEDAWADGLKLWSNYVSGMAKALDLGIRTTKVVGKQAADE